MKNNTRSYDKDPLAYSEQEIKEIFLNNWPLVEKIHEQLAYEKDVFENNAVAPCEWPLVETIDDANFEIK